MEELSSQPPSPSETTAGSDFGAPVDIGAGVLPAEPTPASAAPSVGASDHESTARLVAYGIDALMQSLGAPPPEQQVPWALSDEEQERIATDLVPVLKKYDVEDLPYQEEAQAIVSVCRSAVPRLRRWYREKKEGAHDRSGHRETRQPQNGVTSQVGDSPFATAGAASRVLA